MHRSVGDVASELTAAFQLAMAQVYSGRSREALSTCSGVVRSAESHGELWNRGYGHWVAAISHLHLGDLGAAGAAVAATMAIQRDFRDGVCTALCVEVSSWVATESGKTDDAAVLAAAAGAVWRRIGTSLSAFGPHAFAEGRRHADRIAEVLGEEHVARVRAEYAQTDVADAVRLGLVLMGRRGATAARRPAPQPAPVPASRLTGREREIARLIAQGLSNRAIAAQLTISPRTVDGHVERILRKRDFSSRSQVASWVASGVSSAAT